MEAQIPVFAIVGHPNKGKSSIVSTLAQDSSVSISPLSGTTVHCRTYPMRVDGKELYRLVDTPGFQRARAAMDWMQRHSTSASDHVEVVGKFVEKHRNHQHFSSECELLTPILAGAGILYVIDGSIPYGPEYDAEMEILRWTGQPSMALINQIGKAEFFEQWQQPLSQYFKIVRVFNAQTASFDRQIQLLTGFSELSDDWRQPLRQAADQLRAQRRHRMNLSARCITESLVNMMQASETSNLGNKDDQVEIDKAVEEFQQKLIRMENRMRSEVESYFNYHRLEREEAALGIASEDLFSERTWKLFGLSRDQLVTTGMIGGAAGGSLLDIGSGGLTMFLGSGLGAIIGGASAWFGAKQLIGTRILGLPMGGHQVVVGPIRNLNFPWVLLGRAVTHLQLVSQRTHAMRDQLEITHSAGSDIMSSIPSAQRRAIQRIFTSATKGHAVKEAELSRMVEIIVSLVATDPDSLKQDKSSEASIDSIS